MRTLATLLLLTAALTANAAPKTLSPLTRMRCDPAAEQSIRRFSSWTLVLGVVAYMLAWAIAPIAYAGTLATSLLGGATLLVLARLAWAMWGPKHV